MFPYYVSLDIVLYRREKPEKVDSIIPGGVESSHTEESCRESISQLEC